ncbi:hypothetical protein [Haladaptatus sp. DFWS20]|uniref:hypothetical protein n=1 Tax=Haladaptatus sp. DFWS20 TaxID=3403467 RepID=UPI003EBF7BB1
MSRYEDSFKIDLKTDLYAAHRILERIYDTIREESRSVREGIDDADELLDAFQTLRDAPKQRTSGELTITLERDVAGFED